MPRRGIRSGDGNRSERLPCTPRPTQVVFKTRLCRPSSWGNPKHQGGSSTVTIARLPTPSSSPLLCEATRPEIHTKLQSAVYLWGLTEASLWGLPAPSPARDPPVCRLFVGLTEASPWGHPQVPAPSPARDLRQAPFICGSNRGISAGPPSGRAPE